MAGACGLLGRCRAGSRASMSASRRRLWCSFPAGRSQHHAGRPQRGCFTFLSVPQILFETARVRLLLVPWRCRRRCVKVVGRGHADVCHLAMTQRRQQGAYEDLIQLGDAPPAYDDALGSPGSAPAVPPRSRPMSYTAPAPTRHNMSAASSSNASLGRNNTMPHGGRVPTPNFGQAPQQSYAPPPGPPGPARQSSTSSSSYLPPSHPPPAPASGLQRSTSIEDEFAPLKRYKVRRR